MSDIVLKQESTLTTKTTPAMSDLLRLVGSDDHSYKTLVSDVAKAIIETYAGSTVAGSAQSVKSALDALNSKLLDFGSIGNGKTYAEIFEYVWSDLPEGAYLFYVYSSGAKMFVGMKNGKYGSAYYLNFNGGNGRVINSNGTFSQA